MCVFGSRVCGLTLLFIVFPWCFIDHKRKCETKMCCVSNVLLYIMLYLQQWKLKTTYITLYVIYVAIF